MGWSWPRSGEPAEGAVPGRVRSWTPGVSRGDGGYRNRQESVALIAPAASFVRARWLPEDRMDQMSLFVALTGIAVLLQAGVLLAMYLAMRKSSQRMEELAGDVKTKVLPTVVEVQAMITVLRPKVETIAENLSETTTTLRSE